MNTHDSRWMESIMGHNIIDIRHRAGINNPVVDGLSRMWNNHARTSTDSSTWSVLPDWEASRGITHDILLVQEESPNTPTHPLEAEFRSDIFFMPIIRHLLGKTAGAVISERRHAMHRAEGFNIENGRLWRVSSKPSDRVAKTWCRPTKDGFQLALKAHKHNGHFQADLLKLKLRDRHFWPGLNVDCRQACIECSHCKNFGPPALNALLQLMSRAKPFDFIAGDYVSLPAGKGGFKTLGVYVDTCSNFVWVDKIKAAGTARSTLSTLENIRLKFATMDTFMADGGSHFDNEAVSAYCAEHSITHITTPAYAPWVNGLVESSNKLILGRLKHLCSPDLDADPEDVDPASIPRNWPDHLDEAIRSINDHIIPTLNAMPREILFGMQFTPNTSSDTASAPTPTTPDDVNTHFVLTNSLRSNTYLCTTIESNRHKEIFDSNTRVPDLKIGDLVQMYDSKADFTYATINKMTP